MRTASSAASCMRARVSAVRNGDGPSSISFWCRRWTEHSRSPSTRAPPRPSPSTCTSTWCASTTAFSRYRPASPNAASASAAAVAKSSSRVSGSSTRRMPRPPPPAAAFNSTGKPAFAANAEASRALSSLPRRAGDERQPGGPHRLLRERLVAEHLHRLGGRADEGDVVVEAGAHERGVLAQEPVPGVDGVASRRDRRRDDARDLQVALGRRTGARRRRRDRPRPPRSRCDPPSSRRRRPRSRARGRRGSRAWRSRPGSLPARGGTPTVS